MQRDTKQTLKIINGGGMTYEGGLSYEWFDNENIIALN